MIYRISIIAVALLALVSFTKKGAEKLALAGSGSPTIVIVDKTTGAIEWQYKLPDGAECNSVCVTPDNNVLFSYRDGVRMVDQQGGTIFDLPVHNGEAQTARIIDGDKILVAICASPAKILELNLKGEIIRQVNYNLDIKDHHAQFRQVAKAKNENYLIPVMAQAKVLEIDQNGTLCRTYNVPESPFSVKELLDNNLMVSTGGGGVVVVNRKTGQLIKTLACGIIAKQDTLKFATEAIKTPRSVIVSNWQGHHLNTDAQIVELNDKGDVIYRFRDTTTIRFISALFPFQK